MQVVRRSVIAWLVAAFVPSLLLGIFYVAILLQEQNRRAEESSLDRATDYLKRVDAKLAGDLAALSVLSRSQYVRSSTPDEARLRMAAVMSDFSHWKNVILTDASSRSEIWQTRAHVDIPSPARADVLDFASGGAVNAVQGIQGGPRECACILIHRRIAENGSLYVLTIERDVSDLHELLTEEVGPGEVAALVDRAGLFLVRTVEHDKRFGTPATEYVRAAVARGGSGIYSGITYEGLHNRTAYATSEVSGWSAHIAVPARSYNLLSTGYVSFMLLAVVATLLFAGAFTWYGLRDLQARRREERARAQSYKLEAIGALSSAVAHDFNNLLAIMSACIRLLGKSDDASKREQIIREGLSAAERGAKLVGQLLTFARDKPPELTCCDLSVLVEGIRDLLVRSLGRGIALEVDISSRAQHVRTNRAQLELVLINMAVNARDAMPDGGTFSVITKMASLAGYVDVMIKDTGVGMPPQVAARAMEPFFTTKPEGKGTGLGLAQAHMLAKDSGGSLDLETMPSKGALFILRLPACQP